MESARSGDGDAFAALFEATVGLVFSSVYRRCGDRALAEDLTSDAYMRAMKALRRFDGSSRDFQAWVIRIARNRFLDHVKSGRARRESVVDEVPVTAALSDPESDAVAAVQSGELRTALEMLTDEQRDVLELRFFDGLSVAETAEVVGRSVGAVKAMQFRALRALERLIAADEVVDPR